MKSSSVTTRIPDRKCGPPNIHRGFWKPLLELDHVRLQRFTKARSMPWVPKAYCTALMPLTAPWNGKRTYATSVPSHRRGDFHRHHSLLTIRSLCMQAGTTTKALLPSTLKREVSDGCAPSGDHSYSSPQIVQVNQSPQLMMVCNQGISAYDPASGEVLWKHDWPYDGYRVLQPLLIDAASVVIGTGMGTGTRRIDLKFDEDGEVQVDERWTSRDMKPDYNDYVAYEGNLYGFDRNIFSCVDLETGKRVWKKGRYGHGQVLLLSDAGQLLVLSETGDLVLLRATPERLDELDRMQVLTGKTWNHPVLVGDRLYVRNGEEAACYEMPLQSSCAQPE